MNAVTRAIDLVGLAELARRCGVTYQAVRKWEKGRIPAERCRSVAEATGLEVTEHDLRPDLFDHPTKSETGTVSDQEAA